MPSKYQPLNAFLAEHTGEVVLTLKQIEQLVPDLAPSASRDSRWWWNDDPSHSHSRSWGDAGYTATPDLARGRVRFKSKPLTEQGQ